MQAFAFQPVRHESGIFRFECIKACLRHDLSRHVESARLVTWSSDQNAPPRERLRSSNFLPPGKEQTSNDRGMAGVDV